MPDFSRCISAQPVPTTNYRIPLSHETELVVWFMTDRGQVTSYSVILLVSEQDRIEPVRVYDNAHGVNEMHRHTRAAGKQPAERFIEGEYGGAMRAAIREVLAGYEKMVEAWRL
jgi:hypothetical protein